VHWQQCIGGSSSAVPQILRYSQESEGEIWEGRSNKDEQKKNFFETVYYFFVEIFFLWPVL
jgi:hypothetical protein